jgi:urease accessory protein
MNTPRLVLQPNHPQGWFARLDLEFVSRGDFTVLQKNHHTGPLRLQRPLYPEKAVCHACLLHPPGGVVGGDRLELHAAVKSNAAALITTPGATKFYRSGGTKAVQENFFYVEKKGRLEWLPQEIIVFPGADADSTTRVNLSKQSGFIGWEILCIGLPACGQRFAPGYLRTTFEITREGSPLFTDRLRVTEKDDLSRPSGLRDYPICANFVATGCRPDMLKPLRRILNAKQDKTAAITLMDDLLVARYIGNSSSEAKNLFQELWTWLRPHLSGRKACPPRIWLT